MQAALINADFQIERRRVVLDQGSWRGAAVAPFTWLNVRMSAPTLGTLVHPGRSGVAGHGHVNNPQGERRDIDGNVVKPESQEAHLPLDSP